VRDQGQHLAVLGQDVQGEGGGAARRGSRGQRADQRRPGAPSLVGVGHHHAQVGHWPARVVGGVGGHPVPDDRPDAPGPGDHQRVDRLAAGGDPPVMRPRKAGLTGSTPAKNRR